MGLGSFFQENLRDPVSDFISPVTDPIQDTFDILRGKEAERAALEGAELMAQAGQQGIDLTGQAVQGFQAGLSPFQELGAGAIPQVGRAFGGLDPNNPLSGYFGQLAGRSMSGLTGINPFGDLTGRAGQLFGAGAGDAIMGDPALQAMQSQISRDIMNQQAARGRAGAAETPGLLQQNLLANAQDFLSRERGDILGALTAGERMASGQRGELLGAAGFEEGIASGRRGELMDLLGFGRGVASDIGQAGLAGAGIQAGLLGDIASAQAGGLIGGAGARGQGIQNIISGIGTIGGLFTGGG